MGCGCGRGSNKSKPGGTLRGVGAIGPGRSVTGGIAAGQTPSQMRALELQKRKDVRFLKGIPGAQPTNLTKERRLIEKKRRDMILRKLGK